MGFLSNKRNLFFLISQIPPVINERPDLSSHKVQVCPYRLVLVCVTQWKVGFFKLTKTVLSKQI